MTIKYSAGTTGALIIHLTFIKICKIIKYQVTSNQRSTDFISMEQLNWNKAFALEQLSGDEALLCTCIEVFWDAMMNDLYAIASALKQKDIQGIIDAAHSLKGAAANIGMERISSVAMELEDDAISDNLYAVEEKLTLLEQLAKGVKNIIQNQCSGLGASQSA